MTLQSDNINELMGALAKAQGEMGHASKDSTNPHFKSRYADLAAVWQACREPLAKNGLAVTQTLDFAGERQVLITTLAHSSGQWMKSLIALPIQRPGPQEMGSCISYCRRYSLASMVGVFQDDDDGEAAAKPFRTQERVSDQTVDSRTISESQLQELQAMAQGLEKTVAYILNKFNVLYLKDISFADFNHAKNIFKKAAEDKKKAEELRKAKEGE